MKKKLMTVFTMVLLTIASTSFATSIEISKNITRAFTTSFAKATDIRWDKTGDLFKASFRMKGQSLSAFLSEDWQLIAISRNILSTGLPVYLQLTLNKNFSGYRISDLFEYAAGGETQYYITVENADEKLVLENTGSCDGSLFKKIAK